MESTYYIVQTGPSSYVHRNMFAAEARSVENAAHLPLDAARKIYNAACKEATANTPRRFPRIIKVTTTTKTIKDRR